MKRASIVTVGAWLIASVAVSLFSGCGKVDGTKTAIVVNGEELNVGTANFVLRYEQATAYHTMSSYGLMSGTALWDTQLSQDTASVSGASSSSTDASSEDASGLKQAETYGEDYKNTIQEKLVERLVLSQHAKEYQGEISEELQKKIDDAAEKMYDGNQKILKKMGTTREDVKKALELMSYETLMRPAMTANVDTNVSDEEAAQTTVSYARFEFTDDTAADADASESATASDKEDKKANAEKALSEILSGDAPATADIASIARGIDQSAIATSYSYGKDDTVFDDNLKNIIKGLKDGEVYPQVVEDGSYFYILRLDQAYDAEATASKKETIISNRKTQLYEDTIKGWKDAAKTEYKPAWKKLKVTDAQPYKLTADRSTAGQTQNSQGSETTGTSVQENETTGTSVQGSETTASSVK